MRTLEKNKTCLWVVESLGSKNSVDSDGNYTGDVVTIYSDPKVVSLHLYPSNGELETKLFGVVHNCDMIACTNDVFLPYDALIFTSVPSSNYEQTYDYKIISISKSLNTFEYGLKKRCNDGL